MIKIAGVAELVDAPDSKSGFFGSASSILALGTTFFSFVTSLISTYFLRATHGIMKTVDCPNYLTRNVSPTPLGSNQSLSK